MEFDQEIARVAYELYLKSGRIEGHDFENWLEAERIVLSRKKNPWDKDAEAGTAKAVTNTSESGSATSAETSRTVAPKPKRSLRKTSRETKTTRS
jgi:hypothetical protein